MERIFELSNRVMFYEKVKNGIKPNYAGRSRVEDIFERESMAVVCKEDYGNWGIVVYEGVEIEFLHLYENVKTLKDNANLTSAISRSDTMLCDETIKLKSNNIIPNSLINGIKKYGFKEKLK